MSNDEETEIPRERGFYEDQRVHRVVPKLLLES